MSIAAATLKNLDPSDMYNSVGSIPDQIGAAWTDICDRAFPDSCRHVNHVVVAGMGGSAIPSHLIQSVFRDQLKVPVTIVSDYKLPAWVNRDTLILLSSYSGGTEEVIAAAKQARSIRCPMVALTTGGRLADVAAEERIPAVVFKSEHNPCDQPRIGIGYAATYQIGIFRQLGFIDLTDEHMENALASLRASLAVYAHLGDGNPALELANRARLKAPIIIASEHLSGNAHILANQWNENAKNMATWFQIPELNHHLLEGLSGPEAVSKRLLAVLIESELYDDRVQRRYEITRRVLDEQNVATHVIHPQGKTHLAQAFDMLLLGGFASFYQAVLNRVNPTPIPWVDYFKDLMEKRPA
jgi:glucose/mannose-6-phosphate isomerase